MKSEGKKKSELQEKRVAKVLGGSVNAASGALWSRKGDVRAETLLLELKYTGKKTFTLKAIDLEKNVTEAILERRVPAFGIELNKKSYIILTEDDFIEMYEKCLELKA